MNIKLNKLPKEYLENDPQKNSGRRMLNNARKEVVLFLLNTPIENQGTGISGFMTDDDKELVESITGKVVKEGSESGELFYSLKK